MIYKKLRYNIYIAIYIVLSFLIPFIIILLCYTALHITPFGDNTLLISDAASLYTSDLSYIKRLLLGKENLFYTFKSGIGMNLMGANSGLYNPANIIVIFYDIINWPEMYSLLMAIDISMCGLTMYIFLSKIYTFSSKYLLFSTTYALMGYNVAYCYHFNFILSPELLPVIALGIYNIINNKKPWVYILCLSYSIFCSFYFGYMLCFASVFIFIYFYFSRDIDIDKKRIIINYTIATIISVLLTTFVWLPALISFSGGRLEQNSLLDFTFNDNMSLTDILAKLYTGSNNIEELVNGNPNIYIGSLMLYLCILFFYDANNSNTKKVVHAIPILFYFITFYIKAFSMALQGFSDTNYFNYRYSFIFSFFLILIASEEFSQLDAINIRDIKKAIFMYLALTFIVFSKQYNFVHGGGMLLDVAILCACLGLIRWNRINPIKAPKNQLIAVLVIICSLEYYANYIICTSNLKEWQVTRTEVKEDYFNASVFSEAIESIDKSFYRAANEHRTNGLGYNDPRLFGYNGVTYFGSCESNFVFVGLSKLGLSWYANRTWYSEGLPAAFDDLLGLKYIVSKRNLEEEKEYESILTKDSYKIYYNKHALPIATLINNKNILNELTYNPFLNHNNIWNLISGKNDDIFMSIDDIDFTYCIGNIGNEVNYNTAISMSKLYSIKLDENKSNSEKNTNSDNESARQNFYIKCRFKANMDGPIYSYNGIVANNEIGYVGNPMKYLGIYHRGDIVEDIIPVNGLLTNEDIDRICAEYYVSALDKKNLEKLSNIIQTNAVEIIKKSDNLLTGNIDALEDKNLLFTIPYNEGWKLYIDGNETPLTEYSEIFMYAPLKAGKHTYELKFIPKGMKMGIVISICTIILLIIIVIVNIVYEKRYNNNIPIKLDLV